MTKSIQVFALFLIATGCLSANAQETKPSTNTKQSESVPERKGRKLFATHCAECHLGGGNVVKPGKPVKGSQILATEATFKAYLDQPIGDMPHYEHLITDPKLMHNLYSYVKTLDKPAAPQKETNKESAKPAPKSKSK